MNDEELRARLERLAPADLPEPESVANLRARTRRRRERRATRTVWVVGVLALVVSTISIAARTGQEVQRPPVAASPRSIPTTPSPPPIVGERPVGYDEPYDEGGPAIPAPRTQGAPPVVVYGATTGGMSAVTGGGASTGGSSGTTGSDGAGGSTGGSTGSASATSSVTRMPQPASDPQEPSDVYGQGYGTNEFVDPSDDPLSTFAADVDTAAYSLARRWIRDGRRPRPDLVRVEEFVNAFDYDYPYPDDVTLGITVDGARSPFLPDGQRLLRIGVQSRRGIGERPDANLTLVVDVSGSMAGGSRLELLKDGLRLLVDALRPTDVVTIVAYSDTAWVELQPTPAAEAEEIRAAIDRLRPWQETNAEAGLTLGYDVADREYNPDRVNRVILASDGVANVGETSSGGILERIRQEVDRGIDLVTVGVGIENYNDVLLEQLANDGNGFYSYIDDIHEAERLFVDELIATLVTVARDVKLQVEFDPDTVARYRLIGFENRDVADEDFRNDDVDAGEVGAGHTVTALYAVEVREGTSSGALATVSVRWFDVRQGRVLEIQEDVDVRATGRDFAQAPARFRLAATVAAWAEFLRESPFAPSDYADIQAHAAAQRGTLKADRRVVEFADLVDRAAPLYRGDG